MPKKPSLPPADSAGPLDKLRREHALFVRAATHELRTPLQSIQGFAELLEPGLPPAKIEQYLNIIKRDTARLAAMIDDISLRSQIENNTLWLNPAAFEVEPLLAELSRQLEAYYPEHLVQVVQPAALPLVHADLESLRYILWTLLCNAARYSPAGRRALRLGASASRDDRWLLFSVRDAAPRIRPAYRQALFEPLPEMPKALQRPRFGLGLGLYVARESARRMGGDLWLTAPRTATTQSRGNVFVLRRPAAEKV